MIHGAQFKDIISKVHIGIEQVNTNENVRT